MEAGGMGDGSEREGEWERVEWETVRERKGEWERVKRENVRERVNESG